ncbi:MAG TPA: DNA-3-methyladenine glycosylase I [Candidatus Dormibacteraeota bacterium]|nr:DNA-3-methyladenine glycosylase I [Candidatus Dormibacteraeota bacterium]
MTKTKPARSTPLKTKTPKAELREAVAAGPVRCRWASNEVNIPYHDQEWGVPLHDDWRLFEMLILEGAQAGLSWDTVLKKRARYREVFDGFDPKVVAGYDQRKVRALLADPGIIRNRLKIAATIGNAKAFLAVQKEFGSFDAYVWQFVGGQPKRNAWEAHGGLPAKTKESDALSKDLLGRGFRFVGSTICYAFMQATGMVNDHVVGCFRYEQVGVRAA